MRFFFPGGEDPFARPNVFRAGAAEETGPAIRNFGDAFGKADGTQSCAVLSEERPGRFFSERSSERSVADDRISVGRKSGKNCIRGAGLRKTDITLILSSGTRRLGASVFAIFPLDRTCHRIRLDRTSERR